jgi:hypothetical protein
VEDRQRMVSFEITNSCNQFLMLHKYTNTYSVLERYPLIIPDPPQWEVEFEMVQDAITSERQKVFAE